MNNRNRNKILVMVLSLFALQTSYRGEMKAAPVGMMATTTGKLAAVGMILKAWQTIAQRTDKQFTKDDKGNILKAAAFGMGLEMVDLIRLYVRDLDLGHNKEAQVDVELSYFTSGLFRLFVFYNMRQFISQDDKDNKAFWDKSSQWFLGLSSALSNIEYFMTMRML